MGIFFNSRYVITESRPSAGYQMTTITRRRIFMHFKSFYELIIMRYKLQFAFELKCRSVRV